MVSFVELKRQEEEAARLLSELQPKLNPVDNVQIMNNKSEPEAQSVESGPSFFEKVILNRLNPISALFQGHQAPKVQDDGSLNFNPLNIGDPRQQVIIFGESAPLVDKLPSAIPERDANGNKTGKSIVYINPSQFVKFIDPRDGQSKLFARQDSYDLGSADTAAVMGHIALNAGLDLLTVSGLGGLARYGLVKTGMIAGKRIGRMVGWSGTETAIEAARDAKALTPEGVRAFSIMDNWAIRGRAAYGGGAVPKEQVKSILSSFEKEVRALMPGIGDDIVRVESAVLEGRLVADNLDNVAGAVVTPEAKGAIGRAIEFFGSTTRADPIVKLLPDEKLIGKLARNFSKKGFDESVTMKKVINQSDVPEAAWAINKFNLIAGGTTAGLFKAGEGMERIYAGMNRSAKEALNKVIGLSRSIEIKRLSKAEWKIGGSFVDDMVAGVDRTIKTEGFTLDDMIAARETILRGMSPVQATQIKERSEIYFDSFRLIIDDLANAGIVTSTEREALKLLRYSPIKFMEEIDPLLSLGITSQGKKLTVTSSGIAKLKKGILGKNIETNTAMLYENAVVRAEARISRNNAGRAMHAFIKADPENGVGSLKKVKGFAEMSFMEEGKRQKYWMHPAIVKEFISPESGDVAAWVGVVTGTKLLKFMATGANPALAPILFIRDLAYIQNWTKHYSGFKPKGYAQLAGDLRATFKDAVTRSGSYREYILNGGGMNFLTHQGWLGRAFDSSKNHGYWTETGMLKFQKAQHFLGWMNETAEIWTRLAVMRRAQTNGHGLSEAVGAARAYIDFGQAGSWGRRADGFVAYANASLQGWRGMGRAMKEDPVRAALQVTQSMGFFAGLWAFNRYTNPVGMDETSPDMNRYSMVMQLPQQFQRTDSRGNIRHAVLRLPLEHTLAPFKVLVDALMNKMVLGKEVESWETEVIASISNAVPVESVMFPSIDALGKIAGNKEWWSNKDVWGGANVGPQFEINRYPDRPTSDLAIRIGRIMGAILPSDLPSDSKLSGLESPVRLASAVRSLTADNAYLQGINEIWNWVAGPEGNTGGINRFDTKQEFATSFPIFNKFVSETHPLAHVDVIRKAASEDESRRLVQNQRLDELAASVRTGRRVDGSPIGRQDVKDYIRQIGDDPGNPQARPDALRLHRRFVSTERFAQIMDSSGARNIPGFPQAALWLTLATEPPETMAEVVVVWQESFMLDTEHGVEKMRVLRRILNSMPGFTGSLFHRNLALELSARGLQ